MQGKLQQERLGRYRSRLEMYYAAEEAILLNQEYAIGSRSLKRADLAAVRAAIKELENQIAALEQSGGRNKAARFLPRDI